MRAGVNSQEDDTRKYMVNKVCPAMQISLYTVFRGSPVSAVSQNT